MYVWMHECLNFCISAYHSAHRELEHDVSWPWKMRKFSKTREESFTGLVFAALWSNDKRKYYKLVEKYDKDLLHE